jgi:hypothetical protein
MESTLLLVLVVPSLVAGLICLSLMTHTLNKMLNLDDLTFLSLLGSGFSLALYSVLCLVVR